MNYLTNKMVAVTLASFLSVFILYRWVRYGMKYPVVVMIFVIFLAMVDGMLMVVAPLHMTLSNVNVVMLHVVFFTFAVLVLLKITRPGYVTNLTKKVVVITGCDSGFGHSLAIRLDSLGLRVIALCYEINGEGEKALKFTCSQRLKTFYLDLKDKDSITNAADYVNNYMRIKESSGEEFWAIVNNAGIVCLGEIEMLPDHVFEDSFTINCLGQIRMTKQFLPLLRKSKGRVINVASLVGKVPMYNLGSYCVSKFGIEAFSEVLAQEMKKWGVSVSIIEPGPYQTGIADPKESLEYIKKLWKETSQEVKESYGWDYFEAYNKIDDFATDTNIKPVIDGVEDAILSLLPKRRYSMGGGTTLLPFIFYWMPMVLENSKYLLKKYTFFTNATPKALNDE